MKYKITFRSLLICVTSAGVKDYGIVQPGFNKQFFHAVNLSERWCFSAQRGSVSNLPFQQLESNPQDLNSQHAGLIIILLCFTDTVARCS
ncbi:hypothetical protein GDO86_007628 [Hymenochirus boettgeri]|uniref:Uncharacterized protein n=1 Tax=Hymenochirus boettgeri TaxID=247094 RepID=A0A8T2IUD8_9PIPI|nr:hypothetical protein GDO86_007628 [Hymenochirus boettgeri]